MNVQIIADSMKDLKGKVLDLISQDKVVEAVVLLKQHLTKSNDLMQLVLLSAQLTDINKQLTFGTLDFNEAQKHKNRIRSAVLNFIEKEDFEEFAATKFVFGMVKKSSPLFYNPNGQSSSLLVEVFNSKHL